MDPQAKLGRSSCEMPTRVNDRPSLEKEAKFVTAVDKNCSCPTGVYVDIFMVGSLSAAKAKICDIPMPVQRLPTLLTTLQRGSGVGSRSWRKGVPVTDACQLGCGRTFTVVLTWSGEVWVWGELGGRSIPRPTVIERMLDAKVVRIACGAEHVALLTGDAAAN